MVERACARAGLLGNPSDGYGGKAIALTLPDFAAFVRIRPADTFALLPGASDGLRFGNAGDASRAFRAGRCEDGLRLMRAAIARFARNWPEIDALAPDDPRLFFEMEYETGIPRQVGMAGSSAIVVATLRALGRWFDVSLPPFTLAELALQTELEELGIAAGAMDRVIQAYEGFMVMDLREPRRETSYERLDVSALPPLFLAWDPRGGESSGRAHGALRTRWLRGEPEVLQAIEGFRERVDRGVACLRAGDHAGFRALVDENFDARCAIFDVGAGDREMVSIARKGGAAAKLTGSGGAIVGMPESAAALPALGRAYEAAGYRFLEPEVPGVARSGG